MKEGSHLFQGITDSTMTHGEGWQFIQAGRYLERTVAVSSLVSEHFREFAASAASESDPVHLEWIGLLRSCTAFEAYCKAYTADLQPDRIAEFLVLNPSFPHSIRFSADALEKAVREIGREVAGRRSSRVERIAGRLQATLSFGQIDEILSGGLDSYLETVLRQCRPGPQRAAPDLHRLSRSKWPALTAERLNNVLFHPPPDPFPLRLAGQREPDGSAHAPAHRRAQRCLSFQLSVDPRARVNVYRDYLGNSVHHFDVPGKHTELAILAESLVEMETPAELPERPGDRMPGTSWTRWWRPAITGRC